MFLFHIFLFFYCSEVYDLLKQERFRDFESLMGTSNFNNFRDSENDQSILMKGCCDGDLRILTFLLKSFRQQIDFMNVDRDGQTALHCAMLCRNVDVLKMLLTEDQSSINVRNIFGQTPLHWAAWWNHKAFVKALLAAGANADVLNEDGRTPDRVTRSSEIRKMIEEHRNK